ncbi:MAG: glycosyltransferase family 4 protein [Candidatus Ozemobacteraceae bacterium]|jgi:UDP-GlcNAc:undecaprenyl-phosphate GlcNAc-1-phosphate transferase|nr:undecaprenyl/decaprenyl-phosphate alpha-N-acetylglucosaminyl 1-phosphate transferase [bacterium]NLV93767.1 undecaprenyl/decaprenyl-phosphate alpha-N-acetylglucosaminyl 1-phosphate transferase [Candidatus Riflebacteria bacterium]
MKQIILPFIIAWLSGMLLVPLVRKAAIKLGLVDRPNNRKIHKSPIPRVGGVALFLGSLIGALPFLKENSATLGVLLASAFIFVIGLIDDLIDLKPRVKLAAQIIACFVLFMFGVKINIVTDFIAGQGFVSLGLLTYPLTLLWIIGLTNTVNLVDGVDGLAGGIVFIALSTLLTVRLMIPQVQDPALMSNVLVISASTMGVLLAFLKYNVFPASIFMGDSGAYFLGFVTAALSVAGGAKGSILFPLIVPLIAFGLPVFDVIFAILRRFFKKVPIFQADKEHLHHRLLNRGFTQRETTRFLWMVSSCFGFVAVLVADIPHRGIQAVSGVCLVIMMFLCVSQFIRKSNERK